MFEVQIDNHKYGKVESLQVAIDFCLYRLGVAKKRMAFYISATIKSYEDCCNDWKKVETVWNCTTDDVCNWFLGDNMIDALIEALFWLVVYVVFALIIQATGNNDKG